MTKETCSECGIGRGAHMLWCSQSSIRLQSFSAKRDEGFAGLPDHLQPSNLPPEPLAASSSPAELSVFAEAILDTCRLLAKRETPDYIVHQFFTNCPAVDLYAKNHGWPATLEQIAAGVRAWRR